MVFYSGSKKNRFSNLSQKEIDFFLRFGTKKSDFFGFWAKNRFSCPFVSGRKIEKSICFPFLDKIDFLHFWTQNRFFSDSIFFFNSELKIEFFLRLLAEKSFFLRLRAEKSILFSYCGPKNHFFYSG